MGRDKVSYAGSQRGDLVCVTQARSAPFVADKLARQHVCV